MIKRLRMIILSWVALMIATSAMATIDLFSITKPLVPDVSHFATIVATSASTNANLLLKISRSDEIITSSDLTQSNVTHPELLAWSQKVAVLAFTYDYINYKAEFQALSHYFTPDGYKQFYKALEDSNNIEAVTVKKLMVTAVVPSPPTILNQGLLNGRYSWRIQMPLLVTYQNKAEYTQQSNLVTMLITRTLPGEGNKGLGVIQFVVQSNEKEK